MPQIRLASLAIDGLPTAEDDSFEYKSSKTPLQKLKDKLSRAASAFANSGGGCFIAGVAGDGTPDGGFLPVVNRQSLRDWADQVIATVSPIVHYEIRLFDDSFGKGQIDTGNVILAVSFPASSSAPHMAHDHVYYIRAGAHSAPAPSSVVESLWAHRSSTKPLLTHAVRQRPGSNVVQVGVVALNSMPAVDVEFNVEPLVGLLGDLAEHFPLRLPVVDRDSPFFLDVTLFHRMKEDLPDEVAVTLRYRDVAGNQYSYRSERPLRQAISPIHIGGDPVKEISKAIEKLTSKFDKSSPIANIRG